MYPPFRDTSDGSRQPPRRRSSVHPQCGETSAFSAPHIGREKQVVELHVVRVCGCTRRVLRSSGKGSQAYVYPPFRDTSDGSRQYPNILPPRFYSPCTHFPYTHPPCILILITLPPCTHTLCTHPPCTPIPSLLVLTCPIPTHPVP